MKASRKLKKEISNTILVYDIRAIPTEAQIEQILDIYKRSGVIFYDSEFGDAPSLYNKNPKKVRSKDIRSTNGELEFYQKKRKL